MYGSSAEGGLPEAGAPDFQKIVFLLLTAMRSANPRACVGLPVGGDNTVVVDGTFDLLRVGVALRQELARQGLVIEVKAE